MEYRIVLDSYEGPLDVLLELIRENKLEVNKVSLKSVTDQYIDYIARHDIPPSEMADFLTIAVKLVLLKTRSLLPFLAEEEEDDEEALTRQLKIYQAYWQAAKTIDQLAKGTFHAFGKTRSSFMDQVLFSPPRKKKITTAVLKEAFTSVLTGLASFVSLPQTSIKKKVSLGKKIALLKELIVARHSLSLKRILALDGTSKTDVIVNFLAVLELIKQNEIFIAEKEFSDVQIMKM